MLMVRGGGQRTACIRNHFNSATLTLVDPGVRRRRAGLMGRIELLIGKIRQVMRVFVLRHRRYLRRLRGEVRKFCGLLFETRCRAFLNASPARSTPDHPAEATR